MTSGFKGLAMLSLLLFVLLPTSAQDAQVAEISTETVAHLSDAAAVPTVMGGRAFRVRAEGGASQAPTIAKGRFAYRVDDDERRRASVDYQVVPAATRMAGAVSGPGWLDQINPDLANGSVTMVASGSLLGEFVRWTSARKDGTARSTNNCSNAIQDFLNSGSPWIYIAVLMLAMGEGFVLTTFAINGTIGFVVLGGLLARGYLNPLVIVPCIYLGTLAGDALTFLLSTRLQRVGLLSRHLKTFDKYRAPLALNPFKFVLLAHLTPYLKGVTALLAGGAVPWRAWARAEAVGALCGTLFFTGIGAAGTQLVVNSEKLSAVNLALGVALLILFMAVWVRALRPCRIAGSCSTPVTPPVVGRNWKRPFFFLVYYPLWRPIRWIEAALRKLPTRSLHPDMSNAFPDVRAGDIFLVRLHSPAPWGKWAHTAIATDQQGFCHAFGETITSHRFAEIPVRYTIAHLRVKCDDVTAARAGDVAAAQVGKPVSIFARPKDTAKFSCASLVCHAYASVGVTLRPDGDSRVTPDDLFRSPQVELLRLVLTEGVRAEFAGQEVPNADY